MSATLGATSFLHNAEFNLCKYNAIHLQPTDEFNRTCGKVTNALCTYLKNRFKKKSSQFTLSKTVKVCTGLYNGYYVCYTWGCCVQNLYTILNYLVSNQLLYIYIELKRMNCTNDIILVLAYTKSYINCSK